MALGQDANWDLLNYHLYNGFAFLHGGFRSDLLPAGAQSYLNPVLDSIYAGLALGPLQAAPRTLAAITGLWYGAAIFLALRLAALCSPTRLLAACSLLLAVTGAATVSQVGTSTGEVQVAVVMLAGLVAMLSGPGNGRVLAGGLLFGIAAGLKLTAVVFAPAALLAAIVVHGSPMSVRRLLGAGALFASGWLGGLLLADGWWAAMLLQRFGSPTFPLFNAWFRSPLFPPGDLLDLRFRPHSIADWMFHPLAWAVRPATVVSESPLRDPRLALGLILALALLLRWRRLAAPMRALTVFLLASYVAWLATSAILRYAVVLEVTAGVLAPLLLATLVRPWASARATHAAAAAMVAASLALTRYPATLRAPFGPRTLQATAASLPADTLLVLTFRAPVSYLVPLLAEPGGLRVVNIGDTVLEARGWGLHDQMAGIIRDHPGPIRVLTAGKPERRFPELGQLGLDPALTGCQSIDSNFAAIGVETVQLCDGRRVGIPLLPSPFWRQAATRYRSLVQIDDGSQELIGAAYLQAAGPAARGTKFIDWTDLLWSGVGSTHTALPAALDPGALYVLPGSMREAASRRIDPAHDLLSEIDGVLILAPGWRTLNRAPVPASRG